MDASIFRCESLLGYRGVFLLYFCKRAGDDICIDGAMLIDANSSDLYKFAGTVSVDNRNIDDSSI